MGDKIWETIISGSVILVGGMLVLIEKFRKRATSLAEVRNVMNEQTMGFLGFLLLVLGFVFTLHFSAKNIKASDRDKFVSDSTNSVNDSLTRALRSAQDSLSRTANRQLDTAISALLIEREVLRGSSSIQQKQVVQGQTILDAYKQITGGNDVPFLDVYVTPTSDGKVAGISRFHLISFSVLTKGNYPLGNLRIVIYDAESYYMHEEGVKPIWDLLGLHWTIDPSIKSEFVYPIYTYNVGTITSNKSYRFYAGSIKDRGQQERFFSYNINLQWNNGSVDYILKCKLASGIASLETTDISLNGSKVSDSSRFLQFKMQELN